MVWGMSMRTHKGFTLAEMLAVIGIMLVLMVATFGVFSVFAEQTGPDGAMAVVQAMMNAARDYAATNGVLARVVFDVDPARPQEGSTMMLQYKPPGQPTWTDVRGRRPQALHNQLFVCKEMPPSLPDASKVQGVSDVRKMTEQDVANWKRYEADCLRAVTDFALSNGQLSSLHKGFCVIFDPAGYMSMDPTLTGGQVVQYAMTVIQVGGMKVTAYRFYPVNPNTGTRIVFE
jgi:prepilin-type N-terminal cleavage/methylation domain-containing protein